MERLLKDPEVRDFLGLIYENGKVSSKLTKEAAAATLFEFLAPVLTRAKKVTEVYYKKDRKKYVDDYGPSPVDSKSNLSTEPWALSSPPKAEPRKVETSERSSSVKNKPQSINRKYLIPRDCKISIKQNRVNAIYGELRTDLLVDLVPNACAVLLRVFLEASLDEFISQHGTGCHANDKLHTKLEKVANYMESAGIMTKDELKPVRLAGSHSDGLFSTNTLNAYVHSRDTLPIPSELKLTWERMENFIKALWG